MERLTPGKVRASRTTASPAAHGKFTANTLATLAILMIALTEAQGASDQNKVNSVLEDVKGLVFSSVMVWVNDLVQGAIDTMEAGEASLGEADKIVEGAFRHQGHGNA